MFNNTNNYLFQKKYTKLYAKLVSFLKIILSYNKIMILFTRVNSTPRTGKTWLTNNSNRFNFRPSHSIESAFFGNAVI